MKKFLSKIVVLTILISIFFAPLGGIFSYLLKEKKVNAQEVKFYLEYQGNRSLILGAIGNLIIPGGAGLANEAVYINQIEEFDEIEDCQTRQAQIATRLIVRECFPSTERPEVTDLFTIGAASNNGTENDYDLGCTLLKGLKGILGCIAGVFYALWEVSAKVAELAGRFLDYFVFFSIKSDSYVSGFVDKGWEILRDISNIFFIISLLIIAIKIALDLNASNSKRLIVMVVLMAFLINFSLFTTKVVIDATNILAGIFYNNLTPVNKNGQVVSQSGSEKSISIGLIKGYNPQEIITKSEYYLNDEDNATANSTRGRFIFVTLFLISITLYTAYLFFMVAVLFVSRVVSLWLSMVFSPVAFMSYILPFKIPGFGADEWWDDLLKNAFLAPIFLFFLYIIYLFVNEMAALLTYPQANNADFIGKILSNVVPFAFILMLLMKAKELTIDYSGKLGKSISASLGKVVGTVGTLAGGAIGGLAMGGIAALGTRTLGSVAANRLTGVAGQKLREQASKGGVGGMWAKAKMRMYEYGKGATFDLRQTQLGQLASTKSGMNFNSSLVNLAGAGQKQGGWTGVQDRAYEKLKKQSDSLKTTMTDDEVKTYSAQRIKDYEQKEAEALSKERKKRGGTLTKPQEDEVKTKFAESNGPKPKELKSADELNHEIMTNFANKIGTGGLMGAMVESVLRKTGGLVNETNHKGSEEYNKYIDDRKEKLKKENKSRLDVGLSVMDEDEFNKQYDLIHGGTPTIAQINRGRINKTRMAIGGGIIGGVALGPLGGLAAGLGGDLAGSGKNSLADRFMKDVNKQQKQIDELTKQIDSTQQRLDKTRVNIESIWSTEQHKSVGDRLIETSRDSKGNIRVTSVNEEKVTDEIRGKNIEIKGYESKLLELEKLLVANPTDTSALSQKTSTVNKLKNAMKELDTLNSIKGIKEKLENDEEKLYELTGKKADKSKSSSSSGGSTTKP